MNLETARATKSVIVHRMTWETTRYNSRGNNFASRPATMAYPNFARGQADWTPPVVGSFAGTNALFPVGRFDSLWPNLSTVYDL